MKLKIINIINSILLILCFTFLTFMLFKLNILPTKYFALIIIPTFVIVITLLYFLLNQKVKPKKKIITNIIAFIFSIIFIIVKLYKCDL